MSTHTFRREALQAWLLPVGLFLVAPYLSVVLLSNASELLYSLLYLLLFLAPIAVVGYLLTPWAGRKIPTSKAPAFIVGAIAALSPLIFPVLLFAANGTLASGLTEFAFWAIFALPASVIGSLFFIGACERTYSGEE